MKTLKYLFMIACISLVACNRDVIGVEEQPKTGENPKEEIEAEEPGFEYEEPDSAYLEYINDKLKCMNMPRPKGSYNYPVYPGTKEWKQFKTNNEMIDACQVPEEILKKMSTQAVIQALWEHPLLFLNLLMLFNHQYQADFERLFFPNNAYKELTARADAGKCLLERLVAADPLNPPPIYIFYNAFEVLFFQTIFLSQLNDKEKKTAIETAVKNYDRLKEAGKMYLYDTTWILAGKILVSVNYAPFMEEMSHNEQLRLFIEDRNFVYNYFYSVSLIPLLSDYSRYYINEN
jgi:hypothetical protein